MKVKSSVGGVDVIMVCLTWTLLLHGTFQRKISNNPDSRDRNLGKEGLPSCSGVEEALWPWSRILQKPMLAGMKLHRVIMNS